MANLKTPGVYIEEVSVLPSSVAGVPTAVTGFVGYTQKAEFSDGSSAANQPVRITSLLEFQNIFGGPLAEDFEITLTDGPTAPNIAVGFTTALSNRILFYQLQMFYANGGGVCYVVSCGEYTDPLSKTDLLDGIDKFEQIDEITILNAPESVFLTLPADRKDVYDRMLAQCAKMQDRIAVMDVIHTNGNTIFQDSGDFRDDTVGPDNLKYGAAYYPALNSVIRYHYLDNEVTINDNRTVDVYTAPFDKLNFINNGGSTLAIAATGTITIDDNSLVVAGEEVEVYGVTLVADTDFTIGVDEDATAQNLFTAIQSLVATVTATITDNVIDLTAVTAGSAGNVAVSTDSSGIIVTGMIGGVDSSGVVADKQLYNNITAALDKWIVSLYPSSTMAGVYARVDSERGVWKAPANVGVTMTSGPSIIISDQEQENMNIDPASGKSINAIRNFTGRGTLVWGARTLAGNDNEWRYINVRRLFCYVEDSVKKATEFVVFESNTANTWTKVQGMIEAFLTDLWRSGGLAGSVPKDAFYVRVGLGSTMTAQDILEGRMLVEIGLAAARPAEFIILKFMHKLQES